MEFLRVQRVLGYADQFMQEQRDCVRGSGRLMGQRGKLLRDAGHLERLFRELDLVSVGTVLEWERVRFFPDDHGLLADAIKLHICGRDMG